MTKDHQYTFERFYAYSMARSEIECNTRLLGYNAQHLPEWDTAQLISADPALAHDIAQAVTYLDSRGLLARPYPDRPSVVVIMSNPEERRSTQREALPVAV
jgi:hypothetical protein